MANALRLMMRLNQRVAQQRCHHTMQRRALDFAKRLWKSIVHVRDSGIGRGYDRALDNTPDIA